MRARQRAALAGVAVIAGALLAGQALALPAEAVVQVAEKPKPGKKAEKPKNGNGNGNGNKADDGKKKPDDRDGKKAKRKPKDRKPPATPILGGPGVGAGGSVSLPVIAESGSYVAVAERGGSVVASGTGYGWYSSIAWRTSHGRHTYLVTATDRAGNRSGAAEISVFVDAVPPRLFGLRLTSGTASDARTRVRFTTDVDSRYRILADGEPVAFGRTAARRVERFVDIADGRHRVTVVARDQVGNPRTAWGRVRIRIPELAVDTRVTSEPTERRQSVRVRTSPTARRAVVRLPDERPVAFAVRRGVVNVELSLEDGTYQGGRILVRDSQGRTGRMQLPTLTVDTSPPTLRVVPDEQAAAEGSLLAAVTAEDDAVVRWRLVDREGEVVADGEVGTEGGRGTLAADVDEGRYRLVTAAEDAYGRTTTVRARVDVADEPVPVWLLVLFGLILTVGAVLAVAGLVLAVRWARRPDSPVRPALAWVRDVAERRRRAILGQGAEDAPSGTGIELFDPEAAAVRVPRPRTPEPAGATVPAPEPVLHRTRVRLYETAEERTDGLVLGSRAGELVLARDRIAVVDDRTGEVWSGRVADLVHLGEDTTMVLPAGEDDWIGLVYPDPESTRPALDLVAAEHAERRLARS